MVMDGSVMVDVSVMAVTVRLDADPDHPVERGIASTSPLGRGTPHMCGMANENRVIDNGRVTSALTIRRVQSDVDVLAHAGLDTATFIEEFLSSLSRAVPHVAACVATLDPATHLLTGTYKYGDLHGNDDHDIEWAHFEYGEPDGTTFIELMERNINAWSHSQATDATALDPRRLVRTRDFINPTYGYGDELRMTGRQGTVGWGAVALFRGADEPTFSATETEFVGTLSTGFAAGLRSGLLVRLVGREPCDTSFGPAVVIVGADGRLKQLSVGAESLLREISHERNHSSSDGTIAGLVAGARRYAAGRDVGPAAHPCPPAQRSLARAALVAARRRNRRHGRCGGHDRRGAPTRDRPAAGRRLRAHRPRARRHPARRAGCRDEADRRDAPHVALHGPGSPQVGVRQGRRAESPRADLPDLLRPVRARG